MPRRAGLLLLLICAAAFVAAPSATATATRAEYATQANAVCLAGDAKAKAFLKGRAQKIVAKGQANARGDLKKFGRAMKSFRRILKRLGRIEAEELTALAAIPPAPGDEQIVANWTASLWRTHNLSKPAARLTLNFLRMFVGLLLSTEPEGELSKRKAAHFGKHFKRVNNQLEKVESRLLDESSNAIELGHELGATECGGDTSPDAGSQRARAAIRKLAQG